MMKNIINPWGFETSDSYSFFSHLTWWNRNKLLNYNFNNDYNVNKWNIEVLMKEWKWSLSVNEKLKWNEVVREHTLNAIEKTFMFDYVQRYRFKKEFFNIAEIDWKRIEYKNTNIYYQYKVDNVVLYWDYYDIKIFLLDFKCDKFESYMYVRDNNWEWIVHIRLMPKNWNKEVIKLCTFWYNKAIPQFLSNFILKVKWIKDFIWLRAERKPYRFPFSLLAPSAYPELLLDAWEKVYLKSKIEVIWK